MCNSWCTLHYITCKELSLYKYTCTHVVCTRSYITVRRMEPVFAILRYKNVTITSLYNPLATICSITLPVNTINMNFLINAILSNGLTRHGIFFKM